MSASGWPDPRPGLLAALLVLALYGGVALAVDFPRAAFGFQSDEATYYMMGHSLAADGDLAYRREDLARVWREFPSGPSGVFLKRGRTVGLRADLAAPFVHLGGAPDSSTDRLYYGKSFAYPLVAAPFVFVFGTNGFLVLHAILLSLVLLAGYLFLNARTTPLPALLLAGSFVMASVAPAYFVWITPEIFNLACVALAYFCWLYKEVAPPVGAPRGMQWLLGSASDVVAAALLALATFSKPTNVLLIAPVLITQALKRRWAVAVMTGALFGVIVTGLFAANVATSGDWNYQGGERVTCYGPYPFQTPGGGLEVCMDRTTNRVLTEVIFGPDFWTVLTHNGGYFIAGRYSGLLPYFFPAVFALVAFPFRRHARWEYLVLGVAVAEILWLIIWIPYNYFGGGGVLGNRYFMNLYGLFLFLLPPLRSVALSVAPWIVGGLFAGQLVVNPFYASFHPAEHAKSGPLRVLPVELTLVNDLPINTNLARVRVPFGEQRRFQIYFLDDNAYAREENSFWVRGDSTAEMLVKSAEPASRLLLTLATGDVGVRATVRVAGQTRTSDVPPAQIHQLSLPLDGGFPYQGTRVWLVSIRSKGGFVPMFTSGGKDNRFLGIRVKPELMP